MTVEELIDLLGQYDGEQEVRLAFQPSWPLAFNVGQVSSSDEFVDEDEDSFEAYHAECDGYDGGDYCPECSEQDEGNDEDEDDDAPIVWIAEGGHPGNDSPYAPKAAFETNCW